jgi:hypothetical protein
MGVASLRMEPLLRRLKGIDPEPARKLVTTILRAMDGEPKVRQDTAEDLARDLEQSLLNAHEMKAATEEALVETMFSEFDRLAGKSVISKLGLKPFEANNQVGRSAAIRRVGEAIVMHDFDYRELMVGLSFPATRQYNAFLKNPAVEKLRKFFGDRLVLDPPNLREDGGAYVLMRLSDILTRKPEALAEEAVKILTKFSSLLSQELQARSS